MTPQGTWSEQWDKAEPDPVSQKEQSLNQGEALKQESMKADSPLVISAAKSVKATE